MNALNELMVADSGALVEFPGHRYRLYNVEDNTYQVLRLFMNTPCLNGNPQLIKNGTTVDEVVRVLIDHLEMQDIIYTNPRNVIISKKLEEVLQLIDQDV